MTPAIIAKIERAEVVADEDMLNGILTASDGVMVARGDLGVEVGDAQLIGIQKELISRARKMDRVVITATQMMESMINSSMPTRAEVFDVANAVLDGTDAVMLSAETAVGNYPVEVVDAMADAALGAERQPWPGPPATAWTGSLPTPRKPLPCRPSMPPTITAMCAASPA